MTDEILLALLKRSVAKPRSGIFACPYCGLKRVNTRHIDGCFADRVEKRSKA